MSSPTTMIIPASERKLKNHATFMQVIRNSMTMAYRGLLKFRRTPEQFFDVVLQPILFVPMFAFIFGGAIAGDTKAYLPILIPGVLAQTIITASLVTGTMLREDMDKGVFNRFKSLPMARIAPLAGALMADTVRYVIATVITFAMGFLLGYRPDAGAWGVVASGLLVIAFAWCLSWIFAFFGMIAKSASGVQGISMLILFPLTFLSNAFVPIATLPGWLQGFVKANPISHLISAVRELTTHGAIGNDFWLSIVGAIVIVAIFAPLTVQAYMRKARS
jgi:ABC-2 type transport system permease protein